MSSPIFVISPDPKSSKIEVPNPLSFLPGVLIVMRHTGERHEEDDSVLRWRITCHIRLKSGTLTNRISDGQPQNWVRLGEVITSAPRPGGAFLAAVAYFPDAIEGSRTAIEAFEFVFSSPFSDSSAGHHPDRHAEVWFCRLVQGTQMIGLFPLPLGFSAQGEAGASCAERKL